MASINTLVPGSIGDIRQQQQTARVGALSGYSGPGTVGTAQNPTLLGMNVIQGATGQRMDSPAEVIARRSTFTDPSTVSGPGRAQLIEQQQQELAQLQREQQELSQYGANVGQGQIGGDAFAQAAAAGPQLPGQTPTGMLPSQPVDYTSQLQQLQQSGADPMDIYNTAVQSGMSADQIDQILGFAPGESARWISERGLTPLGAGQQTPGQFPSQPQGPFPPPSGTTGFTTTTTPPAPGMTPGYTLDRSQAGVVTPSGPNTPFLSASLDPQYGMTLDPSQTQAWQATTGTGTEYDAALAGVTPDMLVSDQLAQAMESPAAQRAKEQALEIMNARGMLNSDAAIEAANRAMISEAMPIAQADAATHFQAGLADQAALNVAASFGAQAQDTMTLANMQAMNTAAQDFANSFNAATLQAPETAQRAAELGIGADVQMRQFDMAMAQQGFDQWKDQLDLQLRQAATTDDENRIRQSSLTNLIQTGFSAGVFGGQIAYGPDGTPYTSDPDPAVITGFFDMIYDHMPELDANRAIAQTTTQTAAPLVV